jgi:hypothetical protein
MAGKKNKGRWPLLLAMVMLLVTIVSAAPAWAKKKKKIRSVVIDEVTRVEGKIQKPEVWYLLPRSNLSFEGFRLDKKLAPKIVEAIKKEPF